MICVLGSNGFIKNCYGLGVISVVNYVEDVIRKFLQVVC